MIMYDSTDLSQIPANAPAVAGYVNGRWPTYSQLASRFSGALLLSVAVTAEADADVLDVEPGDASPDQVPGWVRAQLARGASRPCVYASASQMGGVVAALTAAGLKRAQYRLWSAHYTGSAHICGPRPGCGEMTETADATQWTDKALGRNLDESLLADGFFEWYAVLMTQLPVLKAGSAGQQVKNWQALLHAWGHTALAIDGNFGPQTTAATEAFQTARKLEKDGVVGQQTWTAALA